MTEAEKASILEWMDKQIELNDGLESARCCDCGIIAATPVYGHRIHVLDGLGKIAEAVGTEVMHRKGTQFILECFYVEYRNYTFFTTPEDK